MNQLYLDLKRIEGSYCREKKKMGGLFTILVNLQVKPKRLQCKYDPYRWEAIPYLDHLRVHLPTCRPSPLYLQPESTRESNALYSYWDALTSLSPTNSCYICHTIRWELNFFISLHCLFLPLSFKLRTPGGIICWLCWRFAGFYD